MPCCFWIRTRRRCWVSWGRGEEAGWLGDSVPLSRDGDVPAGRPYLWSVGDILAGCPYPVQRDILAGFPYLSSTTRSWSMGGVGTDWVVPFGQRMERLSIWVEAARPKVRIASDCDR